jgi:sigma-B regulation protein RsbU (phosphoserine phosphatase)
MSAAPVSLLIVDDDPVFARFVQQLLQSLSGEVPSAVQWVDTAAKALAELGAHRYELVLLDYNLPDLNGLGLLAQIREIPAQQQPAVIMLTASGNEAVAVQAMKAGARDYLTKNDLDVLPLTRALQNALAQKRLADQVEIFNQQMAADLEMARQLQQSLLPADRPCFPRSAAPAQAALRFHHRFLPATVLAGDFFNLVELSEHEAGVFICDVMGHGVRSALVTAMLRALVDDLAPRSTDPGHFLAEVNRKLSALIHPADTPLFATAFYLIADVASGQMRFANAGHPRPLRLQPAAGLADRLHVLPRSGPALGMSAEATYATTTCPLAPGDLILLFTDGLFEVMAADGQEDFGQPRLLAAARERLKLPPPELLDGLLAEVRRFSGGAEFGDDVCLLGMEVARVGPPDAPAN